MAQGTCSIWSGSDLCGTEAGSYVRLIDSCITQLKAQGHSRTCNESKEEDPFVSSGRHLDDAERLGAHRHPGERFIDEDVERSSAPQGIISHVTVCLL